MRHTPKPSFSGSGHFPQAPMQPQECRALCLLAPCSCPLAALQREDGPLPASERQNALRLPEVDREQSWGLASPCPVLPGQPAVAGAGAGRSLATWPVAPEWLGPAQGRPLGLPAPSPQVPPRPVWASPLGPRPLIEGSSKAHASFSLFVICHIYWLSPPPEVLWRAAHTAGCGSWQPVGASCACSGRATD